jgi:hypothetical protein
MIRNRSEENRRAIQRFPVPYDVLSPALSILRQELDSMIHVIYLLSVADLTERQRLINSTLQGERWKVCTAKGKWRDVTDREMVNLAQHLQGWTQSVYEFGCAFVHLSDFHNHPAQNPFDNLNESERQDILSHMRHYHGGPHRDNPDMAELASYVPQVFKKIASNLEYYLEKLEQDMMLDEEEWNFCGRQMSSSAVRWGTCRHVPPTELGAVEE